MLTKTLRFIERTLAMLWNNRSEKTRRSMVEKHMVCFGVAVLSLGLALLSVVPSAQAQDSNSEWTADFALVVGGGASLQSNELGGVDVVGGLNPGLTVSSSLGIRSATSSLSYRLEIQYARFGLDDEARFGPGGAPITAHGNAGILSSTGNILLSASLTNRLHPYLIVGTGIYRLFSNVDYTASNGRPLRSLSVFTDGRIRFGLNGGIGLETVIGSVSSFVEVRLHSVFSGNEEANFVPVSVGVRF